MYCTYYGFKEKPFQITPNPRFLYLSRNHREAFAHLLYGINAHAGFIELTGEVGTGKTTVLRTLLEQLDDSTHRTALILNPCLSALELLRSINREFGILHEGLENGALLDELTRFLLSENREGRTVVLVIDEAQNLAPQVLEQIRLISNLETESDKLIQIVLVGQPELHTLLAEPMLRQLAQRITVQYHLLSMDFEDSCSYIRHRLQIAGGGGWINFTDAAMRRVFKFAKGSPRLINIACDRALLVGYGENTGTISAQIAAHAIKELRGPRLRKIKLQPLLAAVIALLCVVFLVQRYSFRSTMASNTAAVETVPPPAVTKKTRAVTVKTLSPPPPAESAATSVPYPWAKIPGGATAAVNAVARSWQISEKDQAAGTKNATTIRELARQRNLGTIPLNGRLDKLLQTDVPVIVEVKLPQKNEARYLAVTAAGSDRVSIAPAVNGRSEIPREELDRVLSGKGFILWKNHQNIPVDLNAGSKGIEVIRLQILLLGAGYLRGQPSGTFDDATRNAITVFRREHKLKETADIDQRMLLLLYRDNSAYFTPRLGKKG